MIDYSSLIFRLKFDGVLTPFLANEFILSNQTLDRVNGSAAVVGFYRFFVIFRESFNP